MRRGGRRPPFCLSARKYCGGENFSHLEKGVSKRIAAPLGRNPVGAIINRPSDMKSN